MLKYNLKWILLEVGSEQDHGSWLDAARLRANAQAESDFQWDGQRWRYQGPKQIWTWQKQPLPHHNDIFQDFVHKMYNSTTFPSAMVDELTEPDQKKLHNAVLHTAEEYGTEEQERNIKKHLYSKNTDTSGIEVAREYAHEIHHNNEYYARKRIAKSGYSKKYIEKQLKKVHSKMWKDNVGVYQNWMPETAEEDENQDWPLHPWNNYQYWGK